MDEFNSISLRVGYFKRELDALLDDLVAYELTPEEWEAVDGFLDDVDEDIAQTRSFIDDLIEEKDAAIEEEEE